MDTIRIDTSRWPIVIHTAEGSAPDGVVDDYLRTATEILARREPHVTILDARRVGHASAYTRQRAREWLSEHRAELSVYCRGYVYVLSSPIVRFVAMTTLLFARLPMPYRVCEDLDEAMAWARERLTDS